MTQCRPLHLFSKVLNSNPTTQTRRRRAPPMVPEASVSHAKTEPNRQEQQQTKQRKQQDEEEELEECVRQHLDEKERKQEVQKH